MTEASVAPMTPGNCDLQDFPFMPLHVARLRDSDLAAEEDPEACWYAVLLWSASWHQLPAGSLPDNDVVLAKLLGLGRDIKTFRKHKGGAMRGWVKCSDERLYHPVVAEQVLAAWDSKLHQRHRTFGAAVRKHNERNPNDKRDTPSFDAWIAAGCPATPSIHVTQQSRVTSGDLDRDIDSKREGQGQGQGDLNSVPTGTGGKPPLITDPNEIIFGYGLALLTNAGTAEKQARSFLGGLRKHHGDSALIDKLRECAKAKPLQPLEWLAAALPPGGSAPPQPKPSRHAGLANLNYSEGVNADGSFA
ncbi:YdaU family protein [Acidovorax sp. LjRoot66]|uniref:DUF1376 domain-containing protein n=1 Tax=Acidovorax sp. LjRoot66 TaxID=3342334 RepID=UPI003ECE30F7